VVARASTGDDGRRAAGPVRPRRRPGGSPVHDLPALGAVQGGPQRRADRGVHRDLRGIDRDAGCVVVVRPDQYVAHVLPLDAHEELADFSGGILVDSAT
jgi:hypothetical protein